MGPRGPVPRLPECARTIFPPAHTTILFPKFIIARLIVPANQKRTAGRTVVASSEFLAQWMRERLLINGGWARL